MSVHFFEIKIKNRVVKGLGFKISGAQGNWYQERLYFIAESEAEAGEMAKRQVKKRKILGVPKRREKKYLRREVEIINTRRIA